MLWGLGDSDTRATLHSVPMPEQGDYLLWLGREAGLTCLESPDVAIYRVNVFQGFRRENTDLKHPRSFLH